MHSLQTIEERVEKVICDLAAWSINYVINFLHSEFACWYTYKQIRDALYRLRCKCGEFRHIQRGFYERI